MTNAALPDGSGTIQVFTPPIGATALLTGAALTAASTTSAAISLNGAQVLRYRADGPFRLSFGASDITATALSTPFGGGAGVTHEGVLGVPVGATHFAHIRIGSSDVALELVPIYQR